MRFARIPNAAGGHCPRPSGAGSFATSVPTGISTAIGWLPKAAERLWDAFRRGQLVRRKGRLMAIAEDGAELVLRYRSRDGRMHHLRAAHVINSSGPQFDVSRLDHPLVASMLNKAWLVRTRSDLDWR